MAENVASRSGRSRQLRLGVALALNAALVGGQVAAGLVAHSLGLLSDAGHGVADMAGIALVMVALRSARRAPSDSATYGYHRRPVLAAQANAAFLVAIVAFVAVLAVRRIVSPVGVAGGTVLLAAGASAVVNLVAALVLGSGAAAASRHGGIGVRSALLHAGADAAASAGVAAAGLVIFVTGGWAWLDPAVSLAVGAGIAWQAVAMLREVSGVLLERAPAGLDVPAVRRAMAACAGVAAVHDLHVWSISDQIRAASAHLQLDGHPTLEEASAVGAGVKGMLSSQFGIAHSTLELECEPCAGSERDCDLKPAPASRSAGVGPGAGGL